MLSWIFATRYADVHAESLRERAMEAGQEIAELRTVVARLERRVQELTVQQAAIMRSGPPRMSRCWPRRRCHQRRVRRVHVMHAGARAAFMRSTASIVV
jgi:hypothetical protein